MSASFVTHFFTDWAVDLMNLRLATSRFDLVVVQAGGKVVEKQRRLGLQHHLLSRLAFELTRSPLYD